MSLYRRGKIWWARVVYRKTVYQFTTGCTRKNEARIVEAQKVAAIVRRVGEK